ncbi:putative enoyl-CoA hydratase 1 [Iodidimonas gelatinilytica]|uniref:Enoyl-CoA hydratase 1 n=2 Tax=Iodidimonas TaxID=2066486 RepID=A0ABQ2L6X9_9PROT|nr:MULTISPECIES: MaoC family dehydratase [Iodidimonas]GEQ96560.1 putative enoyl-CoA hydratase 1 [Iodidimonas gelatinilytica]GER00118.1 putative enoyl-CoA hydratase 1 [Iodidimonas gelatinilytica]GER06589.1 putative enoyl-CoA hydratase 1 [Kordiimonadales bacterium JCM 17843]GGO05395.1 putative enoyl-CoA hydratase 1 [Iodidimonas muriae]
MADLPFPELCSKVGQELALSDWYDVTQERINAFADATGDHQWIHIDVARAKAESPFGTTIAHGFFTLSLLPGLMGDFFGDYAVRQGINYGCDTVRFPAPVPSGSKVRGRFVLKAVAQGPQGSLKCIVGSTVEIDGSDKPGCVADQVFLLFP